MTHKCNKLRLQVVVYRHVNLRAESDNWIPRTKIRPASEPHIFRRHWSSISKFESFRSTEFWLTTRKNWVSPLFFANILCSCSTNSQPYRKMLEKRSNWSWPRSKKYSRTRIFFVTTDSWSTCAVKTTRGGILELIPSNNRAHSPTIIYH